MRVCVRACNFETAGEKATKSVRDRERERERERELEREREK